MGEEKEGIGKQVIGDDREQHAVSLITQKKYSNIAAED